MYRGSGGFTILETMIVMAVTSAMLIASIALFSGQRERTEFAQSMRDLETTFSDIINDVEVGYFPNFGDVTCTLSMTGPDVVLDASGSEQGASTECVFLGKAVQLMQEEMLIYPIAGNLAGTSTFESAQPNVVPDLLVEKPYLWGAKLYAIHWDNANQNQDNKGALLAFVSSPNGTGSTVDGYNSGLQRISARSSAAPAINTTSKADKSQLRLALEGSAGLGPLPGNWPSGGKVILCFENAPSGALGRQKAGIVIRGGNLGISAQLQQAGDGFQCV